MTDTLLDPRKPAKLPKSGDDPQSPLPFEPLYSIRAAANATGIKYWLLVRAVNNGDIAFYRFGNKRRRVRLSDIQSAISRTQNVGAACE